jgi:hypothetical protein
MRAGYWHVDRTEVPAAGLRTPWDVTTPENRPWFGPNHAHRLQPLLHHVDRRASGGSGAWHVSAVRAQAGPLSGLRPGKQAGVADEKKGGRDEGRTR